jgi:hypothetical protein
MRECAYALWLTALQYTEICSMIINTLYLYGITVSTPALRWGYKQTDRAFIPTISLLQWPAIGQSSKAHARAIHLGFFTAKPKWLIIATSMAEQNDLSSKG